LINPTNKIEMAARTIDERVEAEIRRAKQQKSLPKEGRDFNHLTGFKNSALSITFILLLKSCAGYYDLHFSDPVNNNPVQND
jgi:hypothetical protein